MDEMDEIVREFLVESNEGLDRMDRELVELEKDPDCRELLASIFRAIHTIKGTSGVLGFSRLEALAHAGENVLSRMRDGKLRLSASITTALLSMVDAVRETLAHIQSTGTEPERDDSSIVAALSKVLVPGPATSPQGADSLIGELLVRSGVDSGAISDALREQSEGDPRRLGEILIAKGDAKPEAVLDAINRQGDSHAAAGSSNIRVDVGLLDKVMNLVGELVLARNQILQHTATQGDPGFLSTAQRLNLITTELQEGVMKTRMQPIGTVWNKFPRLVRDLALACCKQVRIELEGSDTELDKTIIEAIKDPLTHTIRNAVDHGLESPATRAAAGKPPEGTLLLRAFHEGGQVNIEVSDDGCGVDVGRVKQKAIERGLVTSDQASRMSERELTNLVFLPGFSTAEKVTNVSGRGVGMDVVKTNVEKIGGTVDISSTPGQGTTLKIKIPLTLAIIPALVVTSAGERFAIPQISLVELVRIEAEQSAQAIETVQGAPVYRLRGDLLPLVFLNRELCLPTPKQPCALNIVVLQADGRQFGLVVDDINDTEEIVVKPLGKHLKGLALFAGATIMGDGNVALILDVVGIAKKANVTCDEATQKLSANALADESRQRERWLVFKSDDQRRMAVPLSMVARLEEVKAVSVEVAGGREVVQYRGQIMPLLRVGDLTDGASVADRRDELQVIVHTQHGCSVGLVVREILDVVEQDLTVTEQGARAGFIGSAVIQKRVTDLLDLSALVANEVSAAQTGCAYQE